MITTRIFGTPGYLLSVGTDMSVDGWHAAERCGRTRVGNAPAPVTVLAAKQLRPSVVDVPTGTPPSARWRRP